MKADLPSPETLRKLLRYEPETGKLFWRHRPREFFSSDRHCNSWNARFSGKECFLTVMRYGHAQIDVFRKHYKAHRVIWAMQTGAWPDGEVDHIDRNASNNAWSNLRVATRSQNGANRSSKPNSTSNFLGVCWEKRRQKWLVQVTSNYKNTFVGHFDNEEDAARAYDAAAIKIHGEFAHLNFPERKAA